MNTPGCCEYPCSAPPGRGRRHSGLGEAPERCQSTPAHFGQGGQTALSLNCMFKQLTKIIQNDIELSNLDEPCLQLSMISVDLGQFAGVRLFLVGLGEVCWIWIRVAGSMNFGGFR